jgi:single-strand DNA-binding protein
METNTVIGNMCGEPKLWLTKKTGIAMASFTLAVNRRHKVDNELVDRPAVFHRIICFGPLAENVGYTLHKGMEVLAVGEWIDDSYEDTHGQKQKRIAMEARAVGPGLRWATASVTKVERNAPVIPLPNPNTEQVDDHKTGEFSANAKPAEPAEPVVAAPRTTRKRERQAARAG